MGRPPKLTDREWTELGRRYAAGESGRALAREFKVSEAAVRKRFGSQRAEILSAANQLVEAERRVESMPESARASVRTLADQLRGIASNVARAAAAGAKTAAKLHELADKRADMVMRPEPKDGMLVDPGVDMDVTRLQIMANRALAPAMRLVIANQPGAQDDGLDGANLPKTLDDVYDRLLG